MLRGDGRVKEKRRKVLIVTVAGMSSRFSKSLGYPCLKCLYSEGGIEKTLLYRMLHQEGKFDYYLVVGGFKFEELQAAVREYFREFGERLHLIDNKHYQDYGSGYSLYLALKEIEHMDVDEVVFAEGDLYVDRESFKEIVDCPKDVVTCCREAIWADKAVAFYLDEHYGIHYLYDTAHHALEVHQPFLGIFNSGKIWKFTGKERVCRTMKSISENRWQGTNLVFIQEYFGLLGRGEYEVVTFRKWLNCNTCFDYRKIGDDG